MRQPVPSKRGDPPLQRRKAKRAAFVGGLLCVPILGVLSPPDRSRAPATPPAIRGLPEPTCVTVDCHAGFPSRRYSHGPVVLGRCSDCHTPAEPSTPYEAGDAHTFEFVARDGRLCSKCHESQATARRVHYPIRRRRCIACHDPHGSDHPAMMRRANVADVCFGCHDQDAEEDPHPHAPFALGQCTTCHDPHAAPVRKLLIAEGPAPCFGCHGEIVRELASKDHVHRPVVEDCNQCHDPHDGRDRVRLREEVPDLCLGCHEDVAARVDADHRNPESPCLRCHAPHAAGHRGLLSWNEPIAQRAPVDRASARECAVQDVSGAPSVFRRVANNAVLPPLEVTDRGGNPVTLEPAAEGPSVIAFLRPDQEDSRLVLADLATLALDSDAPPARLVVVGIEGHAPGLWTQLGKGLPKRLSLLFDGHGASDSIGVALVPSLAVLDPEGRLRNSYVLHEPELAERLGEDLRSLAAGADIAPDEDARRARSSDELANNATGLEAAGKLSDALRLRRHELDLGLHPAETRVHIGRLLLRLNEPAEAVTQLRRSVELEATAPALLWLGKALVRTGELAEAERILASALATTKDRAAARRALAEIAFRQGDLDEALRQIEAACRGPMTAAQEEPTAGLVGDPAREFVLPGVSGESVRYPARSSTGEPLTVITFWATWSPAAERELQRLAELWPRWSASGARIVAINVEASRAGADQRLAIESQLAERPLPFDVAVDDGLRTFRAYGARAVPTTIVVDAFGRIAMRLPGSSAAGTERFVGLVERRLAGDERAAGAPLQRASLPERRAARHLRLARFLVQRDETELVEYTLKQAIELDRDLLDAYIELAQHYERTGREDLATDTLADARRRFPDEPSLLLATAATMFRRGSHEAARALALRALEQNPALAQGRILLGRIRSSADDLRGALAWFERAAECNPLDPEPSIEIAAVLERLGDAKGAFERYARAYDLLRADR